MNARGAWRLVRYGKIHPGPGFSPVITLPGITEPCAIYLAVALSERRRLLVAPKSVMRRLRDLGWVERATFTAGLAHAVILFDTERIQAAFPPLWWHRAVSSSAELDKFCVEVFANIESLWKAGDPVAGLGSLNGNNPPVT